jgi:hypothetical protein
MKFTREQIERLRVALVDLLIEDLQEETRKEASETDELIAQHENLEILL